MTAADLVLRRLWRASGLSSTVGGRLSDTVSVEWLRNAYICEDFGVGWDWFEAGLSVSSEPEADERRKPGEYECSFLLEKSFMAFMAYTDRIHVIEAVVWHWRSSRRVSEVTRLSRLVCADSPTAVSLRLVLPCTSSLATQLRRRASIVVESTQPGYHFPTDCTHGLGVLS